MYKNRRIMDKKILILLFVIILIVSGCSSEKAKVNNSSMDTLYVTYDNDTCVEYLEYNGVQKGGLSVRYNSDGTIKLNKQCLEIKKENR